MVFFLSALYWLKLSGNGNRKLGSGFVLFSFFFLVDSTGSIFSPYQVIYSYRYADFHKFSLHKVKGFIS